MGVSSTSETGEPSVALKWRTGVAGCLVPVLVAGTILFLYWAANPWAVGTADFNRRNGWMLELAAAFNWQGVGWGFLAIAFAMLLLATKLVWRIFEPVAVRADARGIRLYGPFGNFVPWDGVCGVRFSPFPNPPSLEIVFAHPQRAPFNPISRKRIRLAGIEHEAGEAAAFANGAERLRAAAS